MPPRRRIFYTPAADRAYWRNEGLAVLPLLYLAWGARQYGRAPMPIARHFGWVYVWVQSGAPILARDSARERVPAGTLLLMGPECEFGWEDDGSRTTRLLVWMWRAPRHPKVRAFPADVFRRRAVSSPSGRAFQVLHEMTRNEVRELDPESPAALLALQDLLEANLARRFSPQHQARSEDIISRAMAWLETHVNSRQPLARLADYLALSPSTVQRLFRKCAGTSVRSVLNTLRVQHAERLLARPNASVKEVAYELGYRHPYDLSRAFRRHLGRSPTDKTAGRTR